jgi:DnaJ-class molecular chaperone
MEVSMTKRSYYEILGVDTSVNARKIKSAYFEIAARCHPDRFPDDESKKQEFLDATEAYQTLSDPRKRRTYDRGHAQIRSVGDLYRTPNGQRILKQTLPHALASKKPGADLVLAMEIDETVFRNGGMIRISIQTADGVKEIDLEIPKNASRYHQCKVPTYGEKGLNGAQSGDLIIHFSAKKKKKEKRHG